jgi:pimeloyl-ACP methyl ester carboxylesterase
MPGVTHRFVLVSGVRLHVAERGEGPAVLLLHGFPESWYSWRHQLAALADAGFRAIAPDMRGYGRSDRPEDPARYTQLHLVGDAIGILDALGVERAVVVGHDWGAPVAWHTALLRPDRVRGVAGLSVPHRPRGRTRPTEALRAAFGERFYQLYFQPPGVAEAELGRDPRAAIRRFLHGLSGDSPDRFITDPTVPAGGGILDVLSDPATLPPWLEEADIDFYAGEFARTGFGGGLNWYRAQDLSWELLAPWQGAVVTPPALYIGGDRDLVVNLPRARQLIDNLRAWVPNLTGAIILPGCGHWTQQERPAEVNAALIGFLRGLP